MGSVMTGFAGTGLGAIVRLAVWSAWVAGAMLSGGHALAAQAGWSAPGCGHEPDPPVVEAGSVERYNASIDKVGAYEKAARAYSACVSRQAVAEQSAISNDARSRMGVINGAATQVQKRIAGNFGALSAQLRTAGQKLGAKK
jgi:hypothetical protein